MMATWRTAFGLQHDGVIVLADQVNALTNAYGGNVSSVSDMVTRIGPLGEVAGIAAPSLAAMAQLMNSVGVESEVGATGLKNMALALTKGEAATKAQKGAWKSLGLDAAKVAKGMQRDAEGTILSVMRALARIPAAARPAILSELFGTESLGAIATKLDIGRGPCTVCRTRPLPPRRGLEGHQ